MASDAWRVSDLIAELEPDPWRQEHPFSDDMQHCHDVLFAPGASRAEKMAAVWEWLGTSQPCLFGRMEARQERLDLCLLTENDLERSDREIRATIQQHRLEWKQRARHGERHGFLIVAVSRRIANARRGTVLLDLARRLCELYLRIDTPDRIHHDDLILEMTIDGQRHWRNWKVGVNYFSAQGDGLWWQDHRFPGGIAFSMNSVGHMARWKAEQILSKNPAAIPAEVPRDRLVYWALPTAMNTIGPPVPGGRRGTWLAEHGKFEEDRLPTSFDRRERNFKQLAGYSENRYLGKYHTDHTIPTAYFEERLWREEDLEERDDLYFTYLHRLTDEDYEAMGLGLDMGLGSDVEDINGSEQ
jgi:hypothetical protein